MKTIGIIGAGTMGAGIAQVSAMHGFDVILNDISRKSLEFARTRISTELKRSLEKGSITKQSLRDINSRISTTVSRKQLSSCDLIIEAVLEDVNVKREVFASLEKICPQETLFASNTSSLSITSIASSAQFPERVVGLHFFNPVPRMKLVEIVNGHHTSHQTTSLVLDFVKRIQKIPIVVKDTPGFIVNRVARPFYGEALRLLGEGVATVDEIDRIVKMEGNFKMGPFELMDLIGIDVNLAVTKSVYEQSFHEPRYRPHMIQQRMVDAGRLGRKTKKGFYSY
ncbi:MAG: 3-hydroxybutyryl-CoA dehydrogenase [Bacteroidetes bacterium]|nr:MAG: 3-hydroxybutyryl-CoA dehydrogenase [Bacteroidota bacterium]